MFRLSKDEQRDICVLTDCLEPGCRDLVPETEILNVPRPSANEKQAWNSGEGSSRGLSCPTLTLLCWIHTRFNTPHTFTQVIQWCAAMIELASSALTIHTSKGPNISNPFPHRMYNTTDEDAFVDEDTNKSLAFLLFLLNFLSGGLSLWPCLLTVNVLFK